MSYREVPGGSGVGANACVGRPAAGKGLRRVDGEKWFCSSLTGLLRRAARGGFHIRGLMGRAARVAQIALLLEEAETGTAMAARGQRWDLF